MVAAASSIPEPGTLIAGKYRVGKVLATGGMGVIIEAEHEALGQRVAIKVLQPEAAGQAEFIERYDAVARMPLPGGTVHDLVGNMCELSRDVWNRQDEPCWSTPGVYTAPTCTTASPADGPKHAYRGGCWDIIARLSTSASREGIADNATLGLIGLGFRCIRAAD